MFNPNRLSLARKRRRLTGKGLSDLTGLTPVTISRLENLKNEPEEETVAIIARALKFPKSFFYGDDLDCPSPDGASFRSFTAMSAKERDAALAAGAFAYLLSDWVGEQFNLPAIDLIDLQHENDPANAARLLRQHWNLGEQPITNMVKLLEAKGVRVFSLCENTRSVDAFSCWRNDIPYVFLNTFKTPERSRFDAAHELGHLVLHKHGGPHQGGRAAEQDANAFAASFLMPSADVKARISYVISLDQLVKAKVRWRVSVAALAHRLNKLGIVSDWQYRGFCIQITKRYKDTEPNMIEREESVVWKKVFLELWNSRVTKAQVADTLGLPADEMENLLFGLVSSPTPSSDLENLKGKKPNLKLV